MMRLDETLRHEIIERLKPIHPDKVILFGSYAYGEPNNDSDIDLLVVTRDNFIPQNFAEKMRVTLPVVDLLDVLRKQTALDIIVHTRPMHEKFMALRSMFSREVLQKGIVLYEQDLRSTPLSPPVNGGRYADERKVSSPRKRGEKGGWCVSPVEKSVCSV